MYKNNLQSQAKQFHFNEYRYNDIFLELLNQIYLSYGLMLKDNIKLPNRENDIRDVLVNDYLIPNIKKYNFMNEEPNGGGIVDIYISQDLENSKPEFIIECKRLDDKNQNGENGLNGKYIDNGIRRFLREHYYLENNFNVNAMIGFVVAKIDIEENIKSINILLTTKILTNFVKVIKEITKGKNDIYDSSYQTGQPLKNFHIYHLMMDFSNNMQG